MIDHLQQVFPLICGHEMLTVDPLQVSVKEWRAEPCSLEAWQREDLPNDTKVVQMVELA